MSQVIEGRNGRGNLVLAAGIFLGLAALGLLLGRGALQVRQLDRTVTVKGLAERDVPADIALWPLQFSAASNDAMGLYATIEKNAVTVVDFLKQAGFTDEEITVAPAAVTDKLAEQWGGGGDIPLRYTATRTVTVYSPRIDLVRTTQKRLGELGQRGIVLGGNQFQAQTQYIFTKLNELKPGMIEEATRNAREVAAKFAQDSQSRLGRIKSAQKGQFTVEDRDQNNTHIKKVRVVSTVEYYLVD
jgi:hypothetical protein